MSAPTLYIFPHAGGSANYYVPLARSFDSGVKAVAARYPGRGGKQDLAAFTGIEELADAVIGKLPPINESTGPTAFFGHSMGALVAFEVAWRLQQHGKRIAALFVSACAAPGHSGYDYIPESDRGLLDAAAQMTGVKPEFLDNPEFAARILPTLRGFKAITAYRCASEARLSCPIHVYYADDDDAATAAKVAPWSERTTGACTSRRSTPGTTSAARSASSPTGCPICWTCVDRR